jgi:hypothetical protein
MTLSFDDFSLGPCCVCGGAFGVTNIVMLDKRSPYGHGWGCFECGLPTEGASIVVCDDCIEQYSAEKIHEKAKWFCKPGGPDNYMAGRAPIAELDNAPVHEHDMAKHPDE